MKIFVSLLFIAISIVGFAHSELCVGCPQDHDANDPEVRQQLTGVLATANSPHEIKKIVSIKKQVVAGTKTIVKFENQSGKLCEASWVDQPWISKEPQYVQVKCAED